MEFVDFIAGYWLAIKYILYTTTIMITLSSLDDLFIDIYYWVRRIYRRFFVYSKYKPFQLKELYKKDEKPFAIMVPAWKEAEVIAQMASLATSSLEYHNYHIFIGTYPNDMETQAQVDSIAQSYSNIHKVITHNPGPTSKSDCLNNIVEKIFEFEKTHNMEFEAFVFHDAEDVVHPLELKLFNHLIDNNDFIQIPVIPFERKWYEFTAGHYEDEFAELHGKDLIVRESMLGFVPSAGVGTALNRKALYKLMEIHKGKAFVLNSLTEDYNMGFELFHAKMKLIFVRVPVEIEYIAKNILGKAVVRKKETLIAVREFFPSAFGASVRQKTRWLIGIVFQGWGTIGWQKGIKLRYFLYRDRKALFTNLSNFLSYFLVINILGMSFYAKFTQNTWWFPPLIEDGGIIWTLLVINAFFFFNRLLHRSYFSYLIYGWRGALLSIPRVIWGNIINFLAISRAGKEVLLNGIMNKKLSWDKTTHEFLPGNVTFNKRLGELLLESHVVSEEVLKQALVIQRQNHKMLGEILVDLHLASEEKIAQAIATQKELDYREISELDIDIQVIDKLDRLLLLEHSMVPLISLDNEKQCFAASDQITQVIQDSLSQSLNKDIKINISKSSVIEKLLYKKLFYDLDFIEFRQLKSILINKMLPKLEVEKIIAYKKENNLDLIVSAQYFGFLPEDQLKRIKR